MNDYLKIDKSTLVVFCCFNALFLITIGAGLNAKESQVVGISLILFLMGILNYVMYLESKQKEVISSKE